MAETDSSPLLSVHPSTCLVDEKFEVEVQHLPGDSKITLHTLIHSDDGDDWEAFGHYNSDSSGTVKGTVLHFKLAYKYTFVSFDAFFNHNGFTELLLHSFQR